MLTFQYPFRPFTFGPRSSPFFAMPYLAVGGVGLGRGWGSGPLGAATRCPRRRRPFHFFRDLAFFGDSEDSGFAGHDGRTDDETGLPPLNPRVLRTENRQNFIANFFGDLKMKRPTTAGAACRRAQRPEATPAPQRGSLGKCPFLLGSKK